MGRGSGSRDILLGGPNRFSKLKPDLGMIFIGEMVYENLEDFDKYWQGRPTNIDFKVALRKARDITAKQYTEIFTDTIDPEAKEEILESLMAVIDTSYSRSYKQNLIGQTFSGFFLPRNEMIRTLTPQKDWSEIDVQGALMLKGINYDYDLIHALYLINEEKLSFEKEEILEHLPADWELETPGRLSKNIDSLFQNDYLTEMEGELVVDKNLTDIFLFAIYEK